MALLVGGPIYLTLALWDISLASRLSGQGFDPAYYARLLLSTADEGLLGQYLRDQLLPPFLHYVSLPDASHFFYGGQTALILPPLVPVFLGGLWVTLRRNGLPGALLILWLALTALGNSLLKDNAWTPRFVVAFPALALLLALGLAALLDWLRPRVRWLAPLLILAIGAGQVAYYFGPHLAEFQVQVRPEHDQQDLLFRLHDLPAGTEAYLVTDDPDLWMPLLVFLSRYWGMDDFKLNLRTPARLSDWDLLNSLDPAVGHAFFVEPDDTISQTYLRERFGLGPPQPSPYNVPPEKQYLLLYLPPAASAETSTGVTARATPA